jgi:hypothetical protein
MTLNMSGRVKLIHHKGKEVVLIDMTNLEPSKMLDVAEECKRTVTSLPKGSALTLTDVSGSAFSKETVDKMQEITAANKDHVYRAAVVGVSGLKQIIVSSVAMFSKRDLKLFDSRDAALDWLVS